MLGFSNGCHLFVDGSRGGGSAIMNVNARQRIQKGLGRILQYQLRGKYELAASWCCRRLQAQSWGTISNEAKMVLKSWKYSKRPYRRVSLQSPDATTRAIIGELKIEASHED